MQLLVNGLNYNRKWGIPYNFPANVITKSVNPHWEKIIGKSYPVYLPIFETLSTEEISTIRRHFLILDYSWESMDIHHLYYSIHTDCLKYDIPENRVILITANLDREDSVYNTWFNSSTFKRKIGTFSAPVFVEMAASLAHNIPENPPLITSKFITLSRNPRPHRNVMNYLILENKLNAIVSQNLVNAEDLENQCAQYGIDCKNNKLFTTRYEIDRNDFDTDTPVNWREDLCIPIINHSFVLVQDSTIDDIGFYITEKVWKSIIFKRPIVIWGQAGANHYLKDLGLKMYDKYFDMSFDLIKDNNDRLSALFKELVRVNNELSLLKNPYSWVNKDLETLEFNKQKTLDKSIHRPFIKKIQDYINRNL